MALTASELQSRAWADGAEEQMSSAMALGVAPKQAALARALPASSGCDSPPAPRQNG